MQTITLSPTALTGTDKDACAVITCPGHADTEITEVALQTAKEDVLLFRAHFCYPHMKAFARSPIILVGLITGGQIRGVDPHILD